MGKSNLIKKFLITGAHRSWKIQMGSAFSVWCGVYHWSPLELEIEYEGKINLIKKLLTIGAHWSPLELENSDGINIFWTEWC